MKLNELNLALRVKKIFKVVWEPWF